MLPRAAPAISLTSVPLFVLLPEDSEPLRLFTIFVKGVAKVWMGDLDKRLGPFANRFAMQVRHTVLGDDISNQSAGGNDARTRIEHGNDAGDRSALGGRRDGDDGFTALGARGSPQKIYLSADAAVELISNGVRTDLAGEINLEG